MILSGVDKNLNKLQVQKYKQPKNWGKQELLNTIDEIISEGFVQRIELDLTDLKGIKYYRCVPQTELLTKKELTKILKGNIK